MFFEEGYVPLAEATAEVFRRLQDYQAAGIIVDLDRGLQIHLTVTMWDICDAASKIGVTASNSSFIDGSKELVAWADPRALSNEHVDLRIGSVGSSSLPGEDGKMRSREDLQFQYGGFLSLPVCVPAASFQSSLSYLEEQVRRPLHDDDVVNAARTILGMVKDGQLVTRELATKRLGAKMSRRNMKLAWGLAADHHPPLAAPNRWQGLDTVALARQTAA